MSLKIPSVGKPLTKFEYAVAKSYDLSERPNESSEHIIYSCILVTILYNKTDADYTTYDRLIVFRLCAGPNDNLDELCESIKCFLKMAREKTNKTLKLHYDKKRGSYFDFSGISTDLKIYKYTGQYYKRTILD